MSFLEQLRKRSEFRDDNLTLSMEGRTLRLELSNACNHRCVCCPNRLMKRKRVHMDRDLAFRLLKEGKCGGCKEVGLFINGEPFITSNLDEYIKYAKDIGYEKVFFTTNGALANEEKIRKVIDAGVDSIKFSINAASRETYKKVHGRDDFEKVIANVKYTNEWRRSAGATVRLLASCVVTKFSQNEVQHLNELLKDMVDDIVFFKAENFAGQVPNIEEIRPDRKIEDLPYYELKNTLPCSELFQTVCVTAEGYLTLCCSEAYNNLCIEDVNEMSLIEAWNSKRMQEMRKRHLEGNVEGTLCQVCISGKGEYKPLNEKLYCK